MMLFEKFTDTIFYKKDSEMEYQLEILRKLQKEFPKNERLAHKLKLMELGYKGEQEIEYELKNANIGMYVLRDVNLEYKDLKAQIDYLIVTPGYVYFVECKNLIGNITVNDKGDFIREYVYNGKKIKEGIYSPLRQAERHVEVFKKIWSERNNSIADRLFREQRLSWFKPLVVMANSKNILNTKYAPLHIRNNVIKAEALIDYIKRDLKKIDKELLLNRNGIKGCAFSIMENYNKDIERDYEKEMREWLRNNNIDNEEVFIQVSKDEVKRSVNYNDKNISQNSSKDKNVSNVLSLRRELVEYRKEMARKKDVPAYYIFTNDELDKILELMPNSLNELKNSNILPNVKLKLYGQDIINIIKS